MYSNRNILFITYLSLRVQSVFKESVLYQIFLYCTGFCLSGEYPPPRLVLGGGVLMGRWALYCPVPPSPPPFPPILFLPCIHNSVVAEGLSNGRGRRYMRGGRLDVYGMGQNINQLSYCTCRKSIGTSGTQVDCISQSFVSLDAK